MSERDATADSMSAFMRWVTLFTVTLATTLYATTILVVSVILPQMQGRGRGAVIITGSVS